MIMGRGYLRQTTLVLLAFALLAWWNLRRHPGSLPSVTGAPRAAVLGVRAEPTG